MNLYGLLDAIINKVNRAVKVEKQELDSSLQKQARENINVPSKNEVCNPNLLDNWYFGNPVNTTNRTGTCVIDNWNKLGIIDCWGAISPLQYNIDNGYLSLIRSGWGIKQKFPKALPHGDYTASCIIRRYFNDQDRSFAFEVGVASQWLEDEKENYKGDNWQLITRTFNGVSPTQFTIFFNGNDEVLTDAEILACKFEAGNVQTLAHQDLNGNWVLNEIPNYAEELLKCRQYDSFTGEYIGLKKFSQPRNLLDNSDFRNPVNQRGQTSYIGVGYTIDRWISLNTGNTTTIFDSGVHFQSTELGVLRQYLDIGDRYTNKKMTIAVKFTDETIRCASGTMVGGSGINLVAVANGVSGRFELYRLDNRVTVQFSVENGGVSIEWAALYEGEYTADTLPEYQPKKYEEELLICRQYDLNTEEYIGLRKFSQPRNLFDNSDFTNPVNQRNVSGTITSTGVCIDRWGLYKAGDKDESVSITLSDNGITFNNSSSYFQQRFPIGTLDSSKVYTLAIYYADGTVTAHPGDCYFESDMEIVNTAWKIEVGKTVAHFALYEGKYTTDTLPEYQPKGYAAELMECMRYYQRSYQTTPKTGMTNGTMFYGYSASKYGGGTHFFPVEMRKTPTVTIYSTETGAAGKVANWSSGSDVSATVSATSKGFQLRGGSTGTLTANAFHVCHYEASADL